MKNIKLLDCTLRDGGYVNDWNFGEKEINDIINKLEEAQVDILELGFLKNETYNPDRTVFNSIDQIKQLIKCKKPEIQYAAMIEVVNPLPLELLADADSEGVDIIRVIVWKRLLKEGFEYCKSVREKGYKLCVQPARVDQYSEQEFIDMIKIFNQIDPLAVYIVDSWGTQYSADLLNYVRLADQYLEPEIAIGYHGHNNMMQAFGVAEDFVQLDIERDKIIDASVYGIGRGAGNLNTEMIAKYMNEALHRNYSLLPLIEIYDKYLKLIYEEHLWGYSMSFFLTAVHNCNPDYASYYGLEIGLPLSMIEELLNKMTEEDKIIYSKEKAIKYLEYVRR